MSIDLHIEGYLPIMLTIAFPAIDPVAVSIGPLEIRWYGISYVMGILGAWFYCRQLVNRYAKGIAIKDIDDFIVWATIGVVAGGRLGWALFYMPVEQYPRFWEVLYIWTPGMSFHGGLLGVVIATILFCRRRSIALLSFGDIIASASPIGLFFGRIANFINAELYGRPTDVEWGMVFPGGGPLPRHPSQLYEAFLEGFLLFFLLLIIERSTKWRQTNPGLVFSLFLLGYGLARTFVENYREPDAHLGIYALGMTMGQLLSAPLLLGGGLILVYSLMHKRA